LDRRRIDLSAPRALGALLRNFRDLDLDERRSRKRVGGALHRWPQCDLRASLPPAHHGWPQQPLSEGAARAIEDPSDDPKVAAQKKERSEILRRYWSQRSPERRDIIDLAYDQEKAIVEVSEIIGIPENTVKTRISTREAAGGIAQRCRPESSLTRMPTRAASPMCWCSGSQPKTL
jgi:DNA-directed RNA polymerase specialized sigma24 family protein